MRAAQFVVLLASGSMTLCADIGGPVTGYLFDARVHAVRPILGIPGASLLGAPLDLGFPLAQAWVGPGQDYLLAAGTDGKVRLVRLAGSPSASSFDVMHGVPLRIVFSPAGSSAVLVNSDTADVFTGLPAAPVLARTLPLDSAPAALAVSDDGTAVLFDGSLSAAGGSAVWQPLAPGIVLAAFAPNSRDAALAGKDGALKFVRDVAGTAETTTLAEADDALAGLAGIAVASDGRVLLAGARIVALHDPATAMRTTVSCACSPTGLDILGAVYRLNELSDVPLWLLDIRAAEPRVLFVPAAQ